MKLLLSFNETPLCVAIRSGNTEIAKFLLAFDEIDVNVINILNWIDFNIILKIIYF